MELNILLILKWLLSGLGLICFCWLVEHRKTLKSKIDKFVKKILKVNNSKIYQKLNRIIKTFKFKYLVFYIKRRK